MRPAYRPITLLMTRPDGPDPTGPLTSWEPVPDFADGAVAELHHGPDGTVIADVRIPGPSVPGDRPIVAK